MDRVKKMQWPSSMRDNIRKHFSIRLLTLATEAALSFSNSKKWRTDHYYVFLYSQNKDLFKKTMKIDQAFN